MHVYTTLALGILVALVAATLLGRIIKRHRSPHEPHAVIDNMNTRIDAWWIIASLLFAASWLGAVGLAMLFAAASLQASREYVPGMPAAAWVSLAAAIALQYVLAVGGPSIVFLLMLPLIVAAIIGASALGMPRRAHSNRLSGALLLCVYCVSHVPALTSLEVPNAAGSHLGPALFLVIVVQASDVMQYIAGKLAGRHPIAPRLSPGKTVEGALGGLLGAGVLGAALAALTPYGVGTAAALAVGLAALGIAGGLLFSAMKRKRGIKDWSDVIPGHGGVLDRLDSLCLCAPAFYHLLRISYGT
jgi:phosphatidate cytidylyltransferase